MSDSLLHQSYRPGDVRFVQWGKGKWHVADYGDTACGKAVPEDFRTTIYSVALCARCAKHEQMVKEAEATREKDRERVREARNEKVEANREGRFVVYRCRKCGVQHHPSNRGVPFCWSEMHEADLEPVEVMGPAWEGKP